ncbi:MAG TPA: SDR family NAD(P)-dependent oxidoreductase, partial [Anaerolineae bacterium]|nr:SDR family NAD(P)-dependent oxidoreductase [Anaerolineae bacterium]
MDMTEKVALVTGGSSGIGQATARRLAQAGVKVGLLGLSEEGVYSSTEELQRAGYEILPLVSDVASATQMQQAVHQLVDKWDRLDIVFANAGINGVWAPIEELTAEDWDKTLNVNLRGTFLTVKYTAPYLKKQGGSIIITASVNGTRMFSNTGATAYACSKAGQVALAKMIALELAEYEVRVNVICPGAIETEIEKSTERRDLDKIEEPVEYPEGAIP